MLHTDRLSAYKISFEWSNPGGLSELLIKDNKVLCISGKPKYAYAVGQQKLLPGGKYYWEILLENGVNFKVGVVKASSTFDLDLEIKEACTLSSRGFIQTPNFEKGEDTHQKYSAGDKLALFYDGEKGSLTYFLNEKRIGILYLSISFKTDPYYPVVCLLTEGEMLSAL